MSVKTWCAAIKIIPAKGERSVAEYECASELVPAALTSNILKKFFPSCERSRVKKLLFFSELVSHFTLTSAPAGFTSNERSVTGNITPSLRVYQMGDVTVRIPSASVISA